MNAKKSNIKKKNTKPFSTNKSLNGKYEGQPLFKEKVDRANHILKTFGIPEPSSTK